MNCRQNARRLTFAALVGFALLFALGARGPAASAPAKEHNAAKNAGIARCLSCHGQPGFARIDRSGRRHSLFVDEQKYLNQVPDHRELECTDCHTSMASAGERRSFRPPKGWGKALGRLEPAAREALLACMGCHEAEAREFRRSVHAQAFLQGSDDVPLCYHCHGAHDVLSAKSPSSPVHPLRVPQTCSRCHEDKRLIEKYNLAERRLETYRDSYHGVANRFGSTKVAHCASCHMAHEIRPASDPRSAINPQNLARTCGACHPGATENFARGKMHVIITRREEPLLYYVAAGFRWLTIVTMVMLIGHIFLDVAARFRERLKQRLAGGAPPTPQPEEEIPRLDLFFRVQHMGLALSCLLLIATGIPLKFPDAPFSRWLFSVTGGVEASGVVHRVGAALLILVAVVHVFYIVFTKHGRAEFFQLLPRVKDVVDVVHNVLYFFGLRRERPRFRRFAYYEKFDYWAVYWGCVIMIISGLVLWFEELAMRVLPKFGVDVAHEAHSDEGLLAALAIIIWHFYNVHFNPDRFPMSWTWWDGKISAEEMRKFHAEEYEEMLAGQGSASERREERPAERPAEQQRSEEEQ